MNHDHLATYHCYDSAHAIHGYNERVPTNRNTIRNEETELCLRSPSMQ